MMTAEVGLPDAVYCPCPGRKRIPKNYYSCKTEKFQPNVAAIIDLAAHEQIYNEILHK